MGRFSKLELGSQSGEPPRDRPVPPAQEPSPAARPEQDYDARGYLRLGTDLFLRGQFEEALRRYGQAIKLDSTLLEAWVGQIDALAESGQTREADVWCARALDQFPDDPTLLSIRAVLFARQGMLQRALGASDYALQRGHSLRAWIARGEILLHGKSPNAVACLDKALEQVPDGDWMNLVRIGAVYARHRRHAKALEVFQRACAVEPGRAHLWRSLSECHEHLGFMDRAIETAQRALEIEPNDLVTESRIRRLANTGLLARLRRRFRWR